MGTAYQGNDNLLNDSLLLSAAKLFFIEKRLENLSPEEIVRLAHKNPAFKSIFNEKFQAQLFFIELTQIAIHNHIVAVNINLAKLANAELMVLMEKIQLEHEKSEKSRESLEEYALTLFEDQTYLQSERAKLVDSIIKMLDRFIHDMGKRVSEIDYQVKVLHQQKSVVDNQMISLTREKSALIVKSLTDIVASDFKISLYVDPVNSSNNLYLSITRDKYMAKAKEILAHNPDLIELSDSAFHHKVLTDIAEPQFDKFKNEKRAEPWFDADKCKAQLDRGLKEAADGLGKQFVAHKNYADIQHKEERLGLLKEKANAIRVEIAELQAEKVKLQSDAAEYAKCKEVLLGDKASLDDIINQLAKKASNPGAVATPPSKPDSSVKIMHQEGEADRVDESASPGHGLRG